MSGQLRRRRRIGSQVLTQRISPRKAPTFLRRDILGLQMIAVVAIVLGDLAAWPVGGFVGIDMFFVISGFLITGLLVKEYSSTGRVSLGGFYRNRIRRAVPAAALTLVVTVGAAWIVFDAERFLATAIDGSWAGLLVANWHAIAVGADPFQPVGPGSPLDHYWALAVVGQFYLVWPLLLLGSLFLLGRRGAGSRTTEVMPGLGTVLASLTAAASPPSPNREMWRVRAL